MSFKAEKLTVSSFWTQSKEQALLEGNEFLSQVVGQIICEKKDGSMVAGSCFFYSNKNFLITSFHVISDSVKIIVTYPKFNYKDIAQVVAVNQIWDLAMLKLPLDQEHDLPYLKISPQCNTGELAFCAGFADNSFLISEGIVSTSQDREKIIVSNLTGEGFSGGPCVSRNFRYLFGVIKEDFRQTHHRTTLVPYLMVKHFIESVAEVPRPEF